MTNSQNKRKKGSLRDASLLRAVEAYRSLETEQVRALLFGGQKTGLRMAQRRLQILHQTGHLERTRINGTFAYFQGKQPGMLEHLLNLNWVRMWLQSELKSWEVLHQWVYEQDYGYLRADGFVSIRNSITGKHRFVFVEMDRGTNEFDKVRRYNRMYQKDGYAGWWWTKYADAFPTILVCTITPSRVKLIHSLIQEENKAGLEFQVVLLENIKEAVIWGKSSLTRFNRE